MSAVACLFEHFKYHQFPSSCLSDSPGAGEPVCSHNIINISLVCKYLSSGSSGLSWETPQWRRAALLLCLILHRFVLALHYHVLRRVLRGQILRGQSLCRQSLRGQSLRGQHVHGIPGWEVVERGVRWSAEAREEKATGIHLLRGGRAAHRVHRTDRRRLRHGPPDVEGHCVHRGEHHCDGDALGGVVDELLPASQHPNAMQSLRFSADSPGWPSGRQGSHVRLRRFDRRRLHSVGRRDALYPSGRLPSQNQAHCFGERRVFVFGWLLDHRYSRVLDGSYDHPGLLQPVVNRRPTKRARGGVVHRMGHFSFAFLCRGDSALSTCTTDPG